MTDSNNALARLQASGVTVLVDEYRGWKNRVKIAGKTGNEYTISMRVSDGVWGCSCPGWIFARTCEHLDAMLPALLEAFPGSSQSPKLERRARLAPPPAPTLTPAPEGETPQQRTARILAYAATLPVDIPPAPVPNRPNTVAEEKRRERIRRITSGEIYKKVAPGSPEDWMNQASAFARGDATFEADARAYRPTASKKKPTQSPILATLLLDAMPDDATGLRRAYRRAVMEAFQRANFVDTDPGYVSAFARITTAFETLKRTRNW